MSHPALPSSLLDSGLLGQETPLHRISHALDEYFATDQTRSRAALINFAILADDPGALPTLDAQLQSITRDHACRGLLIAAGDAPPPSTAQAWIKGQCHLDSGGGKFRCSEQITFLVRGRDEGFLANLLYSNLRSDLPLVIWWQASLRPHFQPRLFARIDRLIFDSSPWTDPHREFALVREALDSRTAQFRNAQRGQLLLHDLAYTRGHEHRRAIALLFDAPLAQQQIPHLRRAEVGYRTGHRHSALYLGAWLARQLQAGQPHGASPGRFEFTRDGGAPFTLSLVEHPQPGSPILPSVLLAGRDATFSVRPSPTGQHLLARASYPGLRKDHLVPFRERSEEGLVSDILRRSGSNVLLARVLPRFLELLEGSPGPLPPVLP